MEGHLNDAARSTDRAVTSGWAFYDAGNTPAALREFNTALAADPEHRNALAGVAQCQITFGDLKGALQTTQSLLSIAANSATAHRLHADILRRLFKRREALTAARESIRLDPREPVGYHILAVILYDMKNYKKALETVRQGRAHAPNYDILMAQEALLVFETKGGKAAAPLIEAALQQGLESDYVLVLAANIALSRNDLDRARELITQVLRRNANDEEALSIYLLTDRKRYRLLRAHFQFPHWRNEHGFLGWLGWLSFWLVFAVLVAIIALATRISGLVFWLAIHLFLRAQYNAHRKDVRRHFAKEALKAGF
ncbi:MAG: tetratricopeptide repeat protein [Hyphomonadaceae bacterium]